MLNSLSTVFEPSEARIVNVEVVFEPTELKLPDITPFEVFNEAPLGSEPDT
jgi:hypothetical protein